jgi:hypothetical protein
MTCVELQESLAENDSGSSPAQRAHLKDCQHCAALVADLLVIACSAGELRAVQEPSPRVWNSIEIALRQEGIIRPQSVRHSLLPSFASSWGWARWALPVAAALLITVGIVVRQNAPSSRNLAGIDEATHPALNQPSPDVAIAGLNDDDLLQEVAQQTPALQAQYTENLRHVNEYIQDAKNNVAANPNDEDARHALMDAYQEKAMLFELALDRSLP